MYFKSAIFTCFVIQNKINLIVRYFKKADSHVKFISFILRAFCMKILLSFDKYIQCPYTLMYMAVQKKLYRILLTVTVYYIYENNQQDALYRLTYYSKSALHVSGDVFAQHQEHLTVFTVSCSVHSRCCRLVSRTS